MEKNLNSESDNPQQVVETDPPYLLDDEREDLDAAEPQAREVTYSGQDFDVSGLIRRLENEDILVPTFGHDDERIDTQGFQRSFVWNRPQMDRFIESILLGYPIPGIFLIRQTDNRYLVLDGQQRLITLKAFRNGLHKGKEFRLRNVADRFKGLTFTSLPDDLRRKFENTFIQAIIVSTDGSIQSLDSIYNIFERLNSGGTQLTAHEIRVALYAGGFINFLEKLNCDDHWRSLYGKRSPRLRDQELVLRVLAFYSAADSYKRPLKKFLNEFVAENRNEEHLEPAATYFKQSTLMLDKHVGKSALRLRGNQVTAAFAEALLVGLMKRLEGTQDSIDGKRVSAVVEKLKSNDVLFEAVTRSTADEEQVSTRISEAIRHFEDI